MLSRVLRIAVAACIVGALSTVAPTTGHTDPAAAAPACASYVPPNYSPANASDPTIYVIESHVDVLGVVPLSGMCFPGTPTVTLVDDFGTTQGYSVTADGSTSAGITLDPPSGFSGVAHLILEIEFGGDSWTFDIYNYVGTPAATFPTRIAPISAPVGSAATFDFTGLSFPAGSTVEMTVTNPSSRFTAAFNETAPGVDVTMLTSGGDPLNVPNAVAITVRIGNGIQEKAYELVAFVGVPVPTDVSFGPQPEPTYIEPGEPASFPLALFAPTIDGEKPVCEIEIYAIPDVLHTAEPPQVNGISHPLNFQLDTDFVGEAELHTILTCTVFGGVPKSQDYVLAMYVGVPLPATELAETGGTVPTVVVIAGAGLLLGGVVLVVVVAIRRRRASD